MGPLPLILRDKPNLDSWRAVVDTDELVRQRVAHVAMLVLLFGAHIEHWVCRWSDLHSAKGATDIEARIADFAARTRRICFGEREHILHLTFCMLPADHLVSVANAWLVHQLADAQRRVCSLPRFAELQDIVRHRLLPLIVRHCVVLGGAPGRKRKMGDDATAAPTCADVEWVLRATTVDDLYGDKSKAALYNTPLYPLAGVAPPSSTATTARPQTFFFFEQVTLFLPGLKEKMASALRTAQEPELARWVCRAVALGDYVTFSRAGGETTHYGDARFLLSDLRQDCAPVATAAADGQQHVAGYTFLDTSCSPPAFALRAFVCFCPRHALPKLQRLTVFRPDLSHPPAHRKSSHWSDAAGIDWLPLDTCVRGGLRPAGAFGAGANGSGSRPGSFRVFATCRPPWSAAWQRSSDAAFKRVASGASARTIAEAILRLAPVFHSAVLVSSSSSSSSGPTVPATAGCRTFRLVPRTACVRGELLRLTEGTISVSSAHAPAFSLAFIDACMAAARSAWPAAGPSLRLRVVVPGEDSGDALRPATFMIEYALETGEKCIV